MWGTDEFPIRYYKWVCVIQLLNKSQVYSVLANDLKVSNLSIK